MNNACPNCGAIYAVASKDIGRKIKCKKCSTALRVDEEGLVVDGPPPASAATPARDRDRDDADEEEGSEEVVSPKNKKKKYSGGGSKLNLGEMLQKIGGMPTALFGFGVFLTIWFFFQQTIGTPGGISDNRAQAAYSRVQFELKQEIRKAKDEKEEPEPPEPPSGKADAAAFQAYQTALDAYTQAKQAYDKDVAKKTKEINKKYKKPLNEASDDMNTTTLGNARGLLWDTYGLMFGFLFLSFGCIGYLRSDGALVLRIVAGVVLTILLMAIFAKFSGCRGG